MSGLNRQVRKVVQLLFLLLVISFPKESTGKIMSKKLRCTYQNLGMGDSVTRKIHDLFNILNTRDPHVLFVSETLIDVDAIARIEAAGYKIEAMPLVTERIWAAVKDGVHYKRRTDLELLDFPALWLEIGSGKSSYLICGLYREFFRLSDVNQSRKLVY